MQEPLSPELLGEVLGQYPLSEPRVVGPMEGSNRNDNLLVEDGAKDRYVLRRYRRNADEGRALFQLRFQKHLHECGVPTSEVIETREGELALMMEREPWALFSYVDGSEFDFSRLAQAGEAGRVLARFHRASEKFEEAEVEIDLNPPLRDWWTSGKRQMAELEEFFAGLGVDEEIAFVRTWHSSLMHDWPLERFDALPEGWVHCDFHGRNVVFVGDELRGLFDFDAVQRGLRIGDIATAIYMFGREFRGSRHIRPDAAQLILGEYERVWPLSRPERDALAMTAVLHWAPIAPYYRMLQRDGEDPVPFLRLHVGLMRDLEREMERLRPVLNAG